MNYIPETDTLIKIGFALLFGGAIGIERLIHKHPAGIRTFMILCLAATLATITSGITNGDSGRIAAQILAGVGFIGAGLIIKTNDRVSGITTAACIFMTAVIGIAVGMGMIGDAAVVTVITLLILLLQHFLKKSEK